MADDLGKFFSSISGENQERVQRAIDNAQGEKTSVFPGKYIMQVLSFAWKDKNSGEMKVVPSFYITRKNSLQLRIALEVTDGGTKEVPAGSTIFHNVTISPAQNADDAKIETIMRFTKPILQALTGVQNIEFTKDWLSEYCSAEYKEVAGQYKMSKDHKMKKKVYVIVDDEKDANSRIVPRVKYINKLKPGDANITFVSDELPAEFNDNSSGESERESFNYGANVAQPQQGSDIGLNDATGAQEQPTSTVNDMPSAIGGDGVVQEDY